MKGVDLRRFWSQYMAHHGFTDGIEARIRTERAVEKIYGAATRDPKGLRFTQQKYEHGI